MGEPLGALYYALWQSVAEIHSNWREYVELFGTKPERIDLLNRAAPAFFAMLQDQLWEGSLLHLARLTDRSKTLNNKDKSNLTIHALPPLLSDVNLKAHVDSLIAIATNGTKFAQDWRNRHIAHRDLKLALNPSTKPLAEASRGKVNSALIALANVLNALENHYFQSEVGYRHIEQHGGAVSLIYLIDFGLRAQESQQNRILAGKLTPDDLVHREL